jgi:hypothetical protein
MPQTKPNDDVTLLAFCFAVAGLAVLFMLSLSKYPLLYLVTDWP